MIRLAGPIGPFETGACPLTVSPAGRRAPRGLLGVPGWPPWSSIILMDTGQAETSLATAARDAAEARRGFRREPRSRIAIGPGTRAGQLRRTRRAPSPARCGPPLTALTGRDMGSPRGTLRMGFAAGQNFVVQLQELGPGPANARETLAEGPCCWPTAAARFRGALIISSAVSVCLPARSGHDDALVYLASIDEESMGARWSEYVYAEAAIIRAAPGGTAPRRTRKLLAAAGPGPFTPDDPPPPRHKVDRGRWRMRAEADGEPGTRPRADDPVGSTPHPGCAATSATTTCPT